MISGSTNCNSFTIEELFSQLFNFSILCNGFTRVGFFLIISIKLEIGVWNEEW
jgi:hypothetical protein